MSFYCTLQSNSSSKIFPLNTVSDFKNKLSSVIRVKPGWEVALTECSYTYGNAFMKRGEVLFKKYYQNSIYTTVTHKDLRTEGELLELLEGLIPKSKFEIKDHIFQYSVDVRSNESIEFSAKVSDMLGLPEPTLKFAYMLKENTTYPELVTGHRLLGEGSNPVFVNCGNTKLFVYCDIIRPQYVGDVMAPCLRVVNYDGEYRKPKTLEFIHPQYYDLSVSEFDTIHLYILNEVGEFISFEFGNFTATLRFREKKF